MEIATEILNQLGGRRFIEMTGARNFGMLSTKNGIGFSIPRSHGVKYIRIMLNGLDLYNVEFLNTQLEVIKKYDDVYNDSLQDIFTRETGLYTRL